MPRRLSLDEAHQRRGRELATVVSHLDRRRVVEVLDGRSRRRVELAGLFSSVLSLCRRAGLVRVGVVAIDGTKIAASASREANRCYERIAREILAEAAEADRREDEFYGEARGDELPERLRTSAGRRAALREAREELERERERARPDAGDSGGCGVEIELDPARFVTRAQGRRAWLREGRRALEERRALEARPIRRSRAERLEESARRLEEERVVEQQANAAYEAWRRRRVAADGTRRMAPGSTKSYRPPRLPAGEINTTVPDSRLVKTVGQKAIQGYNAQAAVNKHQILVAREITLDSPDFGHVEPMVDATERELERAGAESPGVVIADAGYWHKRQMENVVGRSIQVLIPPDSGLRRSARPSWDGGLYAFMRRVLATDHAKALYRKRHATIEPVFGQMKFKRRLDRFLRRGRSAVRSEWRLFGASHNLWRSMAVCDRSRAMVLLTSRLRLSRGGASIAAAHMNVRQASPPRIVRNTSTTRLLARRRRVCGP